MKLIYKSTLALIIALLLMSGSKLMAQTEDANKYKPDTSMKSANVKLTQKAIENLTKLWPNQTINLKTTDPELMEIFGNWALGEVMNHGNLDTKTTVMMILGSNIACQGVTKYKKFVNAALNVGVTPVEIKEILYQSVPYVGMAKASDFVKTTNEIFRERKIELPIEGQSTTNRENRLEKGLEVQKEIFGEVIDKMRKNAPQERKHIQDYLSANCFGDYYTRNGLELKTRELLTYSMLISMGGTESQVRGHIQGNLNVGNTRETLLSVTTQLLPYIGYPRTLNALKAIDEVAQE